MSQTKKLSNSDYEVTIDANGHCELPAGMTSVPAQAFWHWDGGGKGCKALKSISIPSSVTKIEYAACSDCSSTPPLAPPSPTPPTPL